MIFLALGLFWLSFPSGIAPVLSWVSFAPVLLLLHNSKLIGKGWLSNFLPGYFYGVGIWALSAFWFHQGLQQLSGSHLLFAITAVIIFFAWAAIPYGLLGALYKLMPFPLSFTDSLVFASMGSLIIYYFPMPFPANLSSGLNRDMPTLQWSQWGGGGLILWLVLLSHVLFTDLLLNIKPKKTRRVLVIAKWPALMLIIYLTGFMSLNGNQETTMHSLSIGIIQPNIQLTEAKEKTPYQLIQKMIHLSEQLIVNNPNHRIDLIVWPELPTSNSITEHSNEQKAIALFQAKYPIALLMNGFAYIEGDLGTYTNQVALLSGQIDSGQTQLYDKQHLVPFGEYLPDTFRFFANWLPAVKQYRTGTHNSPLLIGRYSLSTPLCFEALFPDLVRKQVSILGAQLIINPGDDLWFQSKSANRIHASFSQLRAAENHRAILRVFNSGISHLVLPNGRLYPAIGQSNQAFSHVYNVPISNEKTLYSRWGDALLWLLCAVSLIIGLLRRYLVKQKT